VKFTKMNITGQLENEAAAHVARSKGVAYVIAAVGVLLAGLAGLVAVIRWW